MAEPGRVQGKHSTGAQSIRTCILIAAGLSVACSNLHEDRRGLGVETVAALKHVHRLRRAEEDCLARRGRPAPLAELGTDCGHEAADLRDGRADGYTFSVTIQGGDIAIALFPGAKGRFVSLYQGPDKVIRVEFGRGARANPQSAVLR